MLNSGPGIFPSSYSFARMKMVLIDIANGVQFGRIVYESCNRLICVFFYAVWALPCELIDPVVDRFSALYPDVHFLRITVNLTPHLVPDEVKNVPTFHFFYNMLKVGGFEGNSKKKLNDHLYQLSRDPYSPVITSDD